MKKINDKGSKFKDATSLLASYNSLQVEFTKKCQELARFKKLSERKIEEKNSMQKSVLELLNDASKIQGDDKTVMINPISSGLVDAVKLDELRSNEFSKSQMSEDCLVEGDYACGCLENKDLLTANENDQDDMSQYNDHIIETDSNRLVDKADNSKFSSSKINQIYDNSESENLHNFQQNVEKTVENPQFNTENQSNLQNLSIFATSNWREKVSDFFDKNPNAKKHGKEISLLIMNDSKIASLDNCIDVAYALVCANKPVSYENLDDSFFDDNFLTSKINQHPDLKNKIIASYLSEISQGKKTVPPIASALKGGKLPITPAIKISSLDEARRHLMTILSSDK